MIKDSGKREQYESGAVRDTNEGKIRWDLLPMVQKSMLKIIGSLVYQQKDSSNPLAGIGLSTFWVR